LAKSFQISKNMIWLITDFSAFRVSYY